MAFLDKNGLQTLTNKLVQGDAIKVASHRGHTVTNVISNIARECENVALPNTMTLENRVNEFKVGQGRDVDVSGDVEEGKVEVGLEGKTWQNLIPKISTTDWQIRKDYGEIFEDGSAKLTKHTAVDFKLKRSSDIKHMIKPNTVYTFAYTVVENYGDLFIRGQNSSPFTEEPYKSLKKGFHIYKLTSKSTITESMLQIYYTDSNSTIDAYAIIKDIILLEGDYTQTPTEELPKYFEGIKSSFEEGIVDVEVVGKNLVSKATEWRLGVIDSSTGIYSDDPSGTRYTSNLIYNPSGKELYIRSKGHMWNDLYFYDENKNYLGFCTNQGMGGDYNFPINFDNSKRIAKYFAISFGNQDALENGEVYEYRETDYITPYKKKISFNIGEPLRSLPNGICDEIRNNNGQWELVRRVGKVVLDGSEFYSLPFGSGHPNDNTMLFELSSSVIPHSNSKIINNHFVYYNWSELIDSSIVGVCRFVNNGAIIFRHNSNNLNSFKQWLSQNPTTVYYELQTPIITSIEPIEFEVKPLATMSINSEIAPVSNHKVVLNRAGQIEQGIVQIAELKSRVDDLETTYDSYLLETQHKLSILGFEYELESEEI